MESDIKATVEKLKGAVAELIALRIVKNTSPVYLSTLEEQILRADAKVQTAEVTLLSLIRTTVTSGRR